MLTHADKAAIRAQLGEERIERVARAIAMSKDYNPDYVQYPSNMPNPFDWSMMSEEERGAEMNAPRGPGHAQWTEHEDAAIAFLLASGGRDGWLPVLPIENR